MSSAALASKRWHDKNREYCRAKSLRWYHANTDRVKAQRQARAEKNPKYAATATKKSRYKKKYGLTPEQATRRKMLQNNKCPICRKTVDLVIDHDHGTGVVRGYLCPTCNAGLGMFKDDPALCERASRYLNLWRK